jgi:hypothetical protein
MKRCICVNFQIVLKDFLGNKSISGNATGSDAACVVSAS